MQPTFTDKISFIQKVFGKGILSRSGDDIAVSCPVCGVAQKKKFSISLNSWNFHCWTCNEKGRTLVPILRKLNKKDALDEYRTRFLNQVSRDEKYENETEPVFEYPQGFIPIVELLDSKNPNIRSCISYLKNRGLTESDFFKFRIGLTPDGKDPRRVFFISLDSSGDENYFISRSIDDKLRQRYVNSPLDKTKIVFNEPEVDWDSPIFLVEGVFDQIRLKKNSACLLGSSLARESLLFRRLVENQCEVIVALDGDAQEKAKKIANLLIEYGCDVKMLQMRGDKDLGSMTPEQIEDALKKVTGWNQKMSLLSKIGNIRSGSIL